MRVKLSPLAAALLCGLSSVAMAGERGVDTATVLPAPDLAKVQMEDSKAVGGPFRYGVGIPVEGLRLGAKGFGHWRREGGDWVWSWEVLSPGAKTLDFHFERLQLPLGASLRIVGEGPANERRIEAKDITGTAFSSPYVLGERARFELRVPAALRGQVELALASVTHGYRGLWEAFEPGQKSGSCNVDVACPAGDAWRDQIDSVGHYTFSKGGSSYVCTGTLIGNTARTATPYFLTANHCMSSQTVVGTVVVYWNYQSSTCRTPGSSSSGTPLSRSIASHSQSGAVLRATNAASDFTLIELNAQVPTGANPFFSGWDRSGSVPTSAVGIHHPAGHEKRISVENQALQISGYGGSSGTTHWRVVDWDLGTTEGGSSGSGLWDQNKRLVGQLHGGSAACGNDLSDYYGRLSVSWTGGGTSSTRLSNWLDPAGTGATTLNGYRPGSGGGSDTTPPTTPGNLSATATGSSTINLSWSASSDTGGSGLAGYRIERCTGSSCTNFAQIATTTSTAYTNSGLAASTTYRYRIRAVDGAGNVSAYSSIAQATTQAGGGTTTFFQNTGDYTIRDRSTVESPITVSGVSGNAPSSLKVNVDIKHTYIGDLRVRLYAPNGTYWTLHNRSGGSADNLTQSYTVNASSVPANGTWKLQVYDAARGDTGYIDAWSLQF
ncbi:MAG: lysyl endopeptidase [Lysobacteraceae bacterium]|nr:MAG: lysyl endopeptidase [Xanthomonadaceae bacterium]